MGAEKNEQDRNDREKRDTQIVTWTGQYKIQHSLLHEVGEESILVRADDGPDAVRGRSLDCTGGGGCADGNDAHSKAKGDQDGLGHAVAELEDVVAIIDVREGLIGDGHVEELAEGLPALLKTEVQQVLLWNGRPHLGVMLGVQCAKLLLGASAGAGAHPTSIHIADTNHEAHANPGGELEAEQIPEAVQPRVGEDGIALHPLVIGPLNQDNFAFGIVRVDFFAKVGGDIGDGAVRADEAIPVSARERQEGVVLGEVKGAEESILAEVREMAPGGAAPGVELWPVLELHDVVDGRDAEDLKGLGEGGRAATWEARAENAVTAGEVLGQAWTGDGRGLFHY